MKLPVLGHSTLLPSPTADSNSGEIATMFLVKTAVVPLPSERCTKVMALSGRVRSGLSATIAGSFHLVMVPVAIPE